ncbi:Trishanku [Tetrabaena socialis]|uniref:Trishanku n=1 Tax=Tetrabaena socialis TaxID=47790 RepID=A0A2J8A515_9CHLO|nr:Trishanku [Tetrabaena socialis]|eukprot:PNH07595.1 Trishanku [Tetrabaena socialis]
MFLICVDAGTTPFQLCPCASFSLIAKNFKDQSKDKIERFNDVVFHKLPDLARGLNVALSDIASDGYLSKDGNLTLRVEISSVCANWVKTRQLQQPALPPSMLEVLGGDLLALLDEPGDTADLTITAGDRTFHVHRAILTGRCPYFKTLFAAAFADSSAKELTLADTNPDALALLLRYMYGGVLDDCARELLKPAAALADRLLLAADVYGTLLQRLRCTATHETIVEDMLWADGRGDKQLLDDLQQEYLDRIDCAKTKGVDLLAQRSPQLMARLFKALASSSSKRQRTC